MLTSPHDLDWWEPQPFLVDFRRICRERTRRHAADFTEVSDVRHEKAELAAMEYRLQHHVLRHVALSPIRIVMDDDITGDEGVEPQLLDRPPLYELRRPEHRRR